MVVGALVLVVVVVVEVVGLVVDCLAASSLILFKASFEQRSLDRSSLNLLHAISILAAVSSSSPSSPSFLRRRRVTSVAVGPPKKTGAGGAEVEDVDVVLVVDVVVVVVVVVLVLVVQGCQMAKFDPFHSLDCAQVGGRGRNPRNGRDQICIVV